MEVLLAQSMLKKGHKADQSTLAELVFTCSTLGLHGGGHSVEHKEAVETFNDVIMNTANWMPIIFITSALCQSTNHILRQRLKHQYEVKQADCLLRTVSNYSDSCRFASRGLSTGVLIDVIAQYILWNKSGMHQTCWFMENSTYT